MTVQKVQVAHIFAIARDALSDRVLAFDQDTYPQDFGFVDGGVTALAFDRYSIDLADEDTLENFYLEQTNTNTRFMQFTSGPAILSARSIDFGDIRLLQVSGDGRHLWTDTMLAREWRFAIMVSANGGPRIGQSGISGTTAHLLRPGETAELFTNGRYKTLEVTFTEEFPKKLGWNCRGGQTSDVPEGAVRNLAAIARESFSAALNHDFGDWSLGTLADTRSKLIDTLEIALQPWALSKNHDGDVLSRGARADVLRKARRLLQDADNNFCVSVEALAEEIGVSKRSIFQAFRQEYGIGPRRFREIVRLNALRASLYRSEPDNSSVTNLANDHGFSELGRMAGKYRSLFGELPSETLKRPRQRWLN
ncbi:AraC family transcriptional regulator [Ruegeria arenilitoris]|uniref:AraC family transcriptional regulator n=1 Tax=Ruegeria arenilitoris TaxID=1173585 RepID=UPI00147AD83C|nr:helix-turn-helix domain-containing protein [Ruegeria arenilitoris]